MLPQRVLGDAGGNLTGCRRSYPVRRPDAGPDRAARTRLLAADVARRILTALDMERRTASLIAGLLTAITVAYDEEEKRGFIKKRLMSLEMDTMAISAGKMLRKA